MLFLIIGILMATTVLVMLVTESEIDKTMTNAEEQSVRNIMHLTLLNIENEYADLLFYKKHSLESRKQFLKDFTALVMNNIEHHYEISEKKILSESEAKKLVLEETKKFRYGKNYYFTIFNEDLVAISHPDPKFMGKDMSDLQDARGNFVSRDTQTLAMKGGGFYSYWWKRLDDVEPVEKIGYYKYFSPWEWKVGSGMYLDDIEEDAKLMMKSIIAQLMASLSNIKIAKTGYIFIFNGNKKMIAHPKLGTEDISDMKNPQTGRLIVDELIKASGTPDEPFEYYLKGREQGRLKESYVTYYKPLDWYIASSVYKDELREPAKKLIIRQIYIILMILMVSVLITYFLVNRFARPICCLTNYAKDLSDHSFTAKEHMKAAVEALPLKYKDEVGRLAESFIHMERSLGIYIEELKETTSAKEKIESELRVASDIQMSMVPHIFTTIPQRPEVEIYATLMPAREVGGDLYDFYLLGQNELFFTVGDVSDKGVPAALLMAVTKTLTKGFAEPGRAPSELLSRTNAELASNNPSLMFVTMYFAKLDLATGELAYSNAGHNPPLIIREGGKVEWLKLPDGLVLGVDMDTPYITETTRLNPGDTIVVYSDGVTEAMNKKKELFSEERLLKILEKNSTGTPEDIVSAVTAAVNDFASGAYQSDDITVLAVRYKG
jgi:sigma-B regulation protein RsbU (phosphoserine phosphatase)